MFQFKGVSDFLFTMEDLRTALREKEGNSAKLANREIYIEVSIYDWFWDFNASGWGITVIHGYEVDVILLGDKSRTFKPHRDMDVYVSLLSFVCFFYWF